MMTLGSLAATPTHHDRARFLQFMVSEFLRAMNGDRKGNLVPVARGEGSPKHLYLEVATHTRRRADCYPYNFEWLSSQAQPVWQKPLELKQVQYIFKQPVLHPQLVDEFKLDA
ncbi:hypothetical protein CCR75_004075 [Bremia lactucae]|uniref:Uncharacterized protein n=1 Tax=Bremia lactucae TaxID=4779 RepID=A0A976IKJ1_BRELC|nr:hypothetical protein CCR75_004075 [Bremia lactucae]